MEWDMNGMGLEWDPNGTQMGLKRDSKGTQMELKWDSILMRFQCDSSGTQIDLIYIGMSSDEK